MHFTVTRMNYSGRFTPMKMTSTAFNPNLNLQNSKRFFIFLPDGTGPHNV